jgi:hypothetical protein
MVPLFIPAVWQLHIPPRVHIFLWLLGHNKLMTRDNLKKRNLNKPECCVFCAEPESIHHLFFDCIVAKQIWMHISSFFELPIGDSYESIARFWISNKKHALLNSVCANVLWSLWKVRNDLIFNGQPWMDTKQVWRRVLGSLRRWKLIFKDSMMTKADCLCQEITLILRAPMQLENG